MAMTRPATLVRSCSSGAPDMPLPIVAALRPNGSPVTWTGGLAALLFADGRIDVQQWLAYLATGDAAGLPYPGASVTVRALGAGRDAEECEVEAGPREALGSLLVDRLRAEADGDAEALARAVAALPDRDRVAVQRHELRTERHIMARIARCLVAIDGEATVDMGDGSRVTPAEALQCLPHEVRGLVRAEVSAHINRLSTLSPAGK